MSDIYGSATGVEGSERRPCRVAYTINNAQPVACTIIGDQPLFYMDYECDYEEDGMLDAADMMILENELKNLERQIDSLDKFTEEFVHSPEETYQDFLEDRDIIVKPACAENTKTSVEELQEILSQSRLAQAYLEFAAEHNVALKMSGQVEDGYYDRNAGTILINPQCEQADMVLIAARELRRHWQHRQGALIHPLMFHPDNAVLVNRVQVADLMVSVVRIAWELQLSGMKEAWERIENSSMADLGHALAREAFMDFRTLNNGQASAAVFENWFLSERCRHEDKKLIQQMLADYQGYVFDLEEAEKSITPTLLAALGTMPYGKNYLSAHVDTLMNDPIFTDVRDRSNANFLWFIKFERSFRETEQELQTESGVPADGVRHTAFQQEAQDLTHGEAKAADIITLYADSEEDSGKSGDASGRKLAPKKSKAKNSGKTGSAEIIYLRRWSGE